MSCSALLPSATSADGTTTGASTAAFPPTGGRGNVPGGCRRRAGPHRSNPLRDAPAARLSSCGRRPTAFAAAAQPPPPPPPPRETRCLWWHSARSRSLDDACRAATSAPACPAAPEGLKTGLLTAAGPSMRLKAAALEFTAERSAMCVNGEAGCRDLRRPSAAPPPLPPPAGHPAWSAEPQGTHGATNVANRSRCWCGQPHTGAHTGKQRNWQHDDRSDPQQPSAQFALPGRVGLCSPYQQQGRQQADAHRLCCDGRCRSLGPLGPMTPGHPPCPGRVPHHHLHTPCAAALALRWPLCRGGAGRHRRVQSGRTCVEDGLPPPPGGRRLRGPRWARPWPPNPTLAGCSRSAAAVYQCVDVARQPSAWRGCCCCPTRAPGLVTGPRVCWVRVKRALMAR